MLSVSLECPMLSVSLECPMLSVSLECPMLSVSLECPVFITLLVFSNVYLAKKTPILTTVCILWPLRMRFAKDVKSLECPI
jgi:hypothetical protein